jgi:PAS domain S-box-containing protein
MESAAQLTQIASWEWDLDTDQLLCAEGLLRLFGLEPEEAEPSVQRLIDTVHPADAARVRNEVETTRRSGSPTPIEFRIRRGDGACRQLQSTPLIQERCQHRSHRRLVGFVRDVTEQRCAERELAVEHALARSLATWGYFEQGARTLLRELAEGLGLAAGALWLAQEDALVAHTSWTGPAVDAQQLERAFGPLRLAKGLGLSGQAWERRQPVSSGSDEGDLERRAAAACGICPSVAFPAVTDGDVLAVVVLYAAEPLEPGERLMRGLASAGAQLGAFLARRGGMFTWAALTPRELEVLRLASQGLGRAEIGARLLVSGSTIKTHFEHIYTKLGAPNRVAAVATALREGLIE